MTLTLQALPATRLWTMEEYHHMVEVGIISPNERVELIEGEVISLLDEQVKKKLVEQFLNQPSEVRFEEVRSILEAFGFEEKRSKGSHHSFRDPQGRKVTVPKKGGQKVKGVYVQQIVELLNLREWSDENTEQEEQAD